MFTPGGSQSAWKSFVYSVTGVLRQRAAGWQLVAWRVSAVGNVMVMSYNQGLSIVKPIRI